MKLITNNFELLSKNYIRITEENKAIYDLFHELLFEIDDKDFLIIELNRAISAKTFVMKEQDELLFLNNYTLIYFCKHFFADMDNEIKTVQLISVNKQEFIHLSQFSNIFFELIALASRLIKKSKKITYCKFHRQLRDILSKEQCQLLFNKNKLTIPLFRQYMNISKITYEYKPKNHST